MGLQKTYSSAYGLYVSKIEAIKLEGIRQRKGKCESCEGLEACQYDESGTGYEQMASTYEVNGVRVLYFGVKRCRYLKQRQQEERTERRLLQSKIPGVYSKKGFEDYEVHEGNMEAVAKGLKLGSIYIYSEERRVGKTMLASLIGNELIKRGEGVLFTTVGELMIKLRYNAEGYEEAMRAVREVKTLILDDLGSERESEYNGEQIYMIIDYRVREGLRTIITSNLSIREISGRYGANGERIAERIREVSEIVRIGIKR